MNISDNGLNLIKKYEGCRLRAYKAVPTEKYYTIGWGHYGADVTANMIITQSVADELLKKDLQKFVNHVNTYQSKYNFNQNQFDALVSFAYNVGSISGLTNRGTRSIRQISDKFNAYVKSGGKTLQGLVKRRANEKALFDTPVDNVGYYKKYTGSSPSIVLALGVVGESDVSLKHRAKIAVANNIVTKESEYKGNVAQNSKMLLMLKSGTLKKA